ncbi:response regulator transcription factor [Methylobacterium sp. J-072]|uniref:DNA-binding response regulator, OmpR family, contains REC and winged-helix (WHTH) domain n=1 Tax=Methylobacterium pseudosasicola TaxID=582667 RepID=A0A1I4NFU9_9HYPH|nr:MULTISPECIES: response regulator transcription factor [Methylobacterium]MCJ2094374.1 response regulator transcription factor [Methylobacterium sp. J-072]SFM14187.1 DNA-binding response regulator, OmpR family, contains REC and winged-helix (wHTH) domain [Methylobacterium pseudosasicola]
MRVLVVEDEPRIAADVKHGLEQAGYVADVVADGEAAWFRAETEPYDAMVLDLGLPRLDGLGVLRRLRTAEVALPVLILTARDGWRERVEGIDAGADDYLVKPFRMEELVARLRAILRRTAGHASPVLRTGDVELDTRTRAVSVAGRPTELTALEYRLLAFLLHRQGQVVPAGEVLDHLHGVGTEREANALEALLTRLRRKLGPGVIETRRGQGYRVPEAP